MLYLSDRSFTYQQLCYFINTELSPRSMTDQTVHYASSTSVRWELLSLEFSVHASWSVQYIKILYKLKIYRVAPTIIAVDFLQTRWYSVQPTKKRKGSIRFLSIVCVT